MRKNKDLVNARRRKHRKENHDVIIAKDRQRREASPEMALKSKVRDYLKRERGITNPPEDPINLIVANRKLKRAIREISK